ncbi:flagellar export chaperone FlgN [Massilia sp. Root418]|uniref:flagellar export chaperone FlgN n=1 Tax=Massilia sp. Root418 TaxID=1736532 RepID=UPI000AEFE5B8|nr:flagellar export chaperone FlgN [Massilia sp. Root418]
MTSAVSAPPAAAPAQAQPQPGSRQHAMQLLLEGISADMAAYAELQDLLEQQFDAALRHQRARLEQVAEAVSVLVDAMETRRAQRVACAVHLLGPAPAMAQVFALLKPEPRERLQQQWQALELRVLECKRLSKRNSDLLVEQYTIMQRVLHGEDQIYEPA